MARTFRDRHADVLKRHPVWRPRMLHEILDETAAETPDRPFIITDAGAYTYADVVERSERLAGGLAALGVKSGDHVALLMANHPEFVWIKYAISRLGAVCVPVNFLNRRDELAYVLAQSDAKVLITMDQFRDLDYLDMLDDIAPGWERTGGGDALPQLSHVVVRPDVGATRDGVRTLDDLDGDAPVSVTSDAERVSDIIYTSGTTGQPKGVMMTHDMLARASFTSALTRGFDDGWGVTFSLPMYHVYGYVEGLLTAPWVGGAIIPQTVFDPAETVQAIVSHKAHDVLLVPTMTLAILEYLKTNPTEMPDLVAVISSGQRSPKGIWDDIRTHFGDVELTTGYGMSEVTATMALTRVGDRDDMLRDTNGRMRDAGPAGAEDLRGKLVLYRVVDPQTGAVLPDGQTGELQACGLCVTQGYYNKPKETKELYTADGWIHTGDLGHILEDDYLVLDGRLKESYRCGGEQVMPTEIEDVLTAHPDVMQAHVVPVPDDRMGEVGVAYIVTRKGATVTADDLVERCKTSLARFKVPKHVLFIDQTDLPVTPSGRARKFLLSDRAIRELEIDA
mgnify:FL=1